ncbi:MAG: hypothetical protein U0176_15360 [Bacteroidia bacterium]
MKSSDFLFRLIKAMSKGDRRNFKLYARLQEGDKQYIKLFDAIDRQQEYDEPSILKQFEGERFTNQLSVAKNYLYNYILKTLHIFRKDPKTELNAILHQVQILMGKNLFEQAQKLLRKAKHLAERQERFTEMLFILETERQLWQKREQSKEFEAFIEQIQQEEVEAVRKISNYHSYTHLYDTVHRVLLRSQNARDPEVRSRIQAVVAEELIQNEKLALSVRARLRRYDILVDCSRVLGENAAMLQQLHQLIATYESNEDIRKEKSIAYINALSNLAVVCYLEDHFDASFEALDKMKALKVETEEEEIRIFEKYFHFKIGTCVDRKDEYQGRKVIAEFESEYPQREGIISKNIELGIFYLVGYFYLVIGEPSRSLDWINRILNEPRTELRTDMQAIARIMNLLIHYQLGNWDYLEYEMKSVARFLSNRDSLFQYERTVLKYLRLLSNLAPSANRTSILNEFKEEVKRVTTNEFDKQVLYLFDIFTWIDAQIDSTTMCHVSTRSAQANGN